MKRDMDLARQILLAVEEHPSPDEWLDLEIDGYSPEQVSHHVLLLAEAGLLESEDLSTMDQYEHKPIRLTWAGHDFLEASRDPTRWSQAKGIVKQRGGGMVFDVLKALLVQLTKDAVLGSGAA